MNWNSRARAIDEALQNFEGALKEFISGLYELGDLETFLRTRGIEIYDEVPTGDRTVHVSTGEVVPVMIATLGKSVAVT